MSKLILKSCGYSWANSVTPLILMFGSLIIMIPVTGSRFTMLSKRKSMRFEIGRILYLGEPPGLHTLAGSRIILSGVLRKRVRNSTIKVFVEVRNSIRLGSQN